MADLETTTAAARAVNLSKWFLYRHADKIPAAHRAGRALRWDTPKLKEWMREQATQHQNGSKKTENGGEQ